METYWRISNFKDLGGEGGRRASARWHTAGSPVVYLAESPMAALVETLVHLDVDGEDIPDSYTLLRITAPEELPVQPLDPPEGNEWRQDLELTRRIGDAWLASQKTPLARVPSAMMPYTWNFLLNPEHPDAAKIEIAEVIREHFDNRLFRIGAH
ncbi:MAG TPA: RES family NAD+ phosphorylase [Acidobacteriaceae bacterium]|nr:RES family NAD+ phosphorylase [Acidobacteriaceae bacterium]